MTAASGDDVTPIKSVTARRDEQNLPSQSRKIMLKEFIKYYKAYCPKCETETKHKIEHIGRSNGKSGYVHTCLLCQMRK